MIKKEIIEQEVKRRGIRHLVHFTKSGNFNSILEQGLITRDRISRENIEHICNDQLRLDRTNGICLSVSFPNYKMLYSYRMKFPSISWIILGVSPEILWKKDCLFHHTNAASRSAQDVPKHQKLGDFGFKSLFSDESANRASLEIPEDYSTDPQAEIIVCETIEAEYITAYAVSSAEHSQSMTRSFPGKNFQVVDKFFSPRKDYAYWQKNKEEL